MERMDALLYDCDIREPLFDYLEERFGKARMFEEKIIGKSRADSADGDGAQNHGAGDQE